MKRIEQSEVKLKEYLVVNVYLKLIEVHNWLYVSHCASVNLANGNIPVMHVLYGKISPASAKNQQHRHAG